MGAPGPEEADLGGNKEEPPIPDGTNLDKEKEAESGSQHRADEPPCLDPPHPEELNTGAMKGGLTQGR